MTFSPLTVCCFILALGNRPQGSHGFYLVIIISFALIMVYMLVSPVAPEALWSAADATPGAGRNRVRAIR